MDPTLSDLLTCPRCGPTFGLILLPDDIRDRRVVSGVLGCANCRERFAVTDGVADLRVPGSEAPDASPAGTGGGPAADAGAPPSVWAVPGEEAVRLGAYLGLDEARGTILLAGPAARFAEAVAALSEDVRVIAVGGEARVPVSTLRVSTALPLRGRSLAGAALTGPYAALATEAVRCLVPGGRLLVEPAAGVPDAAPDLEVLARDGAGVVARRR